MFKNIFILITLSLTLNSFAAENINLTKNKSYEIDKELQFQVIRVTDDSRCPKGARCVWAGKVTIEIELNHGGRKYKLKLTPSHGVINAAGIVSIPIGPADKEKKNVGAFSWKDSIYKLVSVSPYPVRSEEEAYVFEITKIKTPKTP